MNDIAIINASPLIFLSRGHHIELLKGFADEIWVPQPVAHEIQQRGESDVTVQTIENTDWLIVKPVLTIPKVITEWRLGDGESSVIALAAAQQIGCEAIIDDLMGRKCAASLGIPVRGTLGIVLAAKKRGIIPKARPIIEDMMHIGLYLSKKILDKALALVDE